MLVGGLESSFVQDIALKVRSAKKTVFVAGAGISCNAGIPDFRSEDGLYSLVKKRFPQTFVKGKDLFDSILFRDEKSAEIFYAFIAELRQATLRAKPTLTHHFLRILKDKKKLLRVYTQNIDGLEFEAGLGPSDVVQLHGNLQHLKCMQCMTTYGWKPDLAEKMLAGVAPDCENCASASLARVMSGKRSMSVGQLRPNIVLYGEEHPGGDDIAAMLKKDCLRKNVGLLLVAGTSLKVHGLKKLVKVLAQATRANDGLVVLINKGSVSHSEWGDVFDFQLQTDVDMWVQDLKSRIPTFFQRQTRIKVEHIPRKIEQPVMRPTVVTKHFKSDPYADKSVENKLLRTPEADRVIKRTLCSSPVDLLSPGNISPTYSFPPSSPLATDRSSQEKREWPELVFQLPNASPAKPLTKSGPPTPKDKLMNVFSASGPREEFSDSNCVSFQKNDTLTQHQKSPSKRRKLPSPANSPRPQNLKCFSQGEFCHSTVY